MRIRPYRKTDASYIREWIADEKVHAMWSAGKLPYGFLENDLENLLAEAEAGYNQSAFTAVLDDGTPEAFAFKEQKWGRYILKISKAEFTAQ
ncbi:MAG: hypothetical protein IJ405_00800 [Lachnospiraceae bacterium]|nr:hypothetical protein [Lachnospiraceae bacterium]MBQ7780554.1 hypothetical protein [Lachnospiraceae bacterium]